MPALSALNVAKELFLSGKQIAWLAIPTALAKKTPAQVFLKDSSSAVLILLISEDRLVINLMTQTENHTLNLMASQIKGKPNSERS
jgi:hypothetical protein